MNTAIAGCGLALNPTILHAPILHGVTPEFAPDPNAIIGTIPLFDSFQINLNRSGLGTFPTKAQKCPEGQQTDNESSGNF
jgi:hypothetical protein